MVGARVKKVSSQQSRQKVTNGSLHADLKPTGTSSSTRPRLFTQHLPSASSLILLILIGDAEVNLFFQTPQDFPPLHVVIKP